MVESNAASDGVSEVVDFVKERFYAEYLEGLKGKYQPLLIIVVSNSYFW